MIGKLVVSTLTVVGILVLSVTAAQAGAGLPSALTSFFVCQGMSGDPSGRVVNIQVPLFNLNLGSIKIGSTTIACAFAKLFDPQTGTEIDPNPAGLGVPQDLKCYAIAAKHKGSETSGPPTSYTATDAFGPESGLLGTQTQFLCAPANFTQP